MAKKSTYKAGIPERLDKYIEFAEATKRFSDVGFYAEVKDHIADLENRLRRAEKFSKKQGEQLAMCAKGMSH